MDQYLSTVIIALITGVFSIISIVLQKEQKKVLTQINEQSTFIDRERILKQKMSEKEKERDALMHKIMILILDTNLYILKNTDVGGSVGPTDEVLKESEAIKGDFKRINEEISSIRKEYDMVLELTNEITKQLQQGNNDSSKKK